MSRPTFVKPTAATEGWDGEISDDIDILLTKPWPIYEHVGTEANLASTFPANQYDRCVVWVNHSTMGWILYHSNGTTWVQLPRQAAAQGDSTATTVADLKTDFNALLAKMRASGTLAP